MRYRVNIGPVWVEANTHGEALDALDDVLEAAGMTPVPLQTATVTPDDPNNEGMTERRFRSPPR